MVLLEEENEALKEKLAVSGSRALQDRAEKWSEKWQDKCIREISGEITRLTPENSSAGIW